MAEKTIPSLPTIPALDNNALFVVDSGTETFKVTLQNLALFLRESLLPAGTVAYTAATTAPSGWLLCDGSAKSRTDYARLFAAIGTTFGTGDGVTTFNLPDGRGRVVAGKDNMGGSAAGRLTNAVSGVTGTTLGAAGGSESYTPAGTIGGSQSIAHTHTLAHTHNFAHVHIWARKNYSSEETFEDWYGLVAASTSTTSISTSNTRFIGENSASFSGSANRYLAPASANTSQSYYTTGVISAPSGSGSSAVTGAASTSTTSGMSTNTIVNGSNFSFTGTAAHRVQPTIVLNMIIKT